MEEGKKSDLIRSGPFRMALFKRTILAGPDLPLSGFCLFHTFRGHGWQARSPVFFAPVKGYLIYSTPFDTLFR